MSFIPPPSYTNGCPYYSNPAFNPDSTSLEMLWIECIESQCRLWDSTSSSCSIEVVQTMREINTNIQGIMTSMYTMMDNMHTMMDNMYKLSSHNHYSHQHTLPHETADVDTANGAALKKSTAAASQLISEKQGNEDLDANGYVYAKDFYIDPDDPDMPEMLSKIPVLDESLPLVSWADYLDSTSPFSIS